MLFNYKITIELNSTFNAPLLGADTTGYRRGIIDKLIVKEIKEMVAKGIEVKEISDESMNITITCKKQLRGITPKSNNKKEKENE